MRPSGDTAVASTIRRPAPDSARWPRWIRCQSPAEPSLAEYWHIGAMMMRLASASAPICKGSKRWGMEEDGAGAMRKREDTATPARMQRQAARRSASGRQCGRVNAAAAVADRR